MSTLATIIQHSFGSPSHGNQRRKINTNCKRQSKTVTVCRWHNTIHRNSKDATRKLLKLINEFGKIAGYKSNAQKTLAFLYTNNERSGREITETNTFTIATKRIKYLGINLPKEAKDLLSGNYKTLMKEFKDDRNRWINIPCSWIGRIIIVKNDHITQGNLPIQCSPYQITNGIFHRTRTKILKFV